MTENIITALIAVCSSGITGFLTWLLSRRKYNAEVDSSRIENLQKSLDFYIELSNDTKMRLSEILERNKLLDAQVVVLSRENNELKEQVKQQSIHIDSLASQVKGLNNSIDNLKEIKK